MNVTDIWKSCRVLDFNDSRVLHFVDALTQRTIDARKVFVEIAQDFSVGVIMQN